MSITWPLTSYTEMFTRNVAPKRESAILYVLFGFAIGACSIR